ncbi:hypothetical protein G0P98_21840 [Yangia sp. PrR004]|nr:hypothetical protein [Salipiger sp. PrR004]
MCERTLARTWKLTFRQDHAAEPAATYTKGGFRTFAARGGWMTRKNQSSRSLQPTVFDLGVALQCGFEVILKLSVYDYGGFCIEINRRHKFCCIMKMAFRN